MEHQSTPLNREQNLESVSVLIMGAAGGLGISAIHVAKAMGARVIAAASEDEKLKLCKEAGADETILYSKDLSSNEDQRAFSSQIKEMTNGNGVDITFDPVGGHYSEPALRAMAWKEGILSLDLHQAFQRYHSTWLY